jgi:Protein of unknown function (DUF2867)
MPNAEHERGSWRIRELLPDFRLEDVWALPAHGGAGDFDRMLELAVSLDPSRADSTASRFLWQLRDQLGRWFDLGRISEPAAEDGGAGLTIPCTEETSLRERLPGDLRATDTDLDFGRLPFQPLYRTVDEAAAELGNRTVHGVVHFAWAPRGEGIYQGEMAVYVKPRGRFGEGYMALIKPFRYLIVYPALMRQFGRAWERRAAAPDAPPA